MTATQPVSHKNLDGYDAPPIEWERVRGRLDEGFTEAPGTGGPNRHTAWVATVRPDGRPHVVPVGVMRVDGALYFTAGPRTQKAKNIARDPHCTITIATEPFDLVFEGEAVKVTDEAELKRLADVFSSQGWEPTVRDGAFYAEFSAPSAGPPPWHLYKVTPKTVFAFGTAEPYGATRFKF